MTSKLKLDRITVDPNQLGGAPCIRGLRIPVQAVANLVMSGATEDEVIDLYPDLLPGDAEQAVAFVSAAKHLAPDP